MAKTNYIHPTGNSYSQALELSEFKKIIFVSGQIPQKEDGKTPTNFGDQCRLVWQNIEAQLKQSAFKLSDIVKITTFLSDRKFRHENSTIRQEILGSIEPALTVIICGIYEEEWLLEIEVIAAK